MASETHLSGEHIWRACLPLLAERVSPATYDGFLTNAIAIDFSGENLRLGVVNEFAKDWLERHHAHTMRECLAEVAQCPVSVDVEVLPEEQLPVAVPAAPAPVPPPAPAPEAAPRPAAVSRPAPVSLIPDATGELRTSPLNPKYTFNDFVVADCNRFAHAAALQVAKSPGQAYNPLFIHSASGLGKTHLIQAIGHSIIANRPDCKVVYISAEAFVNHMISCMRDNTIDRFRQNYRSVDVWLVDDIQFIAAIEGPASEEEFFHTFNTLYETNRQVVIASDCPPRHLQLMNDRLRSRLEMGIVADLRVPDVETRVAILEKKAQAEGVPLSRDILEYVASKIESNIRVLEGALLKICAYASLNQVQITRSLVEDIIGDYSTATSERRISSKEIVDLVSSEMDVSAEDIVSKKRSADIAWARQVAIYLCRELTDNSLARIGEHFGGRDHSTVLHSYNKVAEMIEEDQQVLWLINDLKAAFE
ncbi:MAG: chromosomal replication initiator protein DnaA [candidate division WS1 bacterium]|jgi:chromosomal replication initiator protein|nr:chromosomal replication initiator protein DnaA [candidate division WS1 bacterium]